ncbi:MAG: hypothetical protein EOL97_11285 [Spirochaetia bacterium]|nr:hypothetical protein [Spirochaetia bacterium]
MFGTIRADKYFLSCPITITLSIKSNSLNLPSIGTGSKFSPPDKTIVSFALPTIESSLLIVLVTKSPVFK